MANPDNMTTSFADLPRLVARMTGDEKHGPAANSTLDALWVLYDQVLNVSPATVTDPDRDRFVLSKGHGPASYFAVLAAKGFFDPDILDHFGDWDSPLGLHPDRLVVPGVEVSSGSLGHGLPIAIGRVLALRAQRLDGPRVVCLLGDAECDEGSIWEAVAHAGRAGLARLTVAVVDNHSSTHGWPGGLGRRFEVEGWDAATVDGRDHDALAEALRDRGRDRPDVVVADIPPAEERVA